MTRLGLVGRLAVSAVLGLVVSCTSPTGTPSPAAVETFSVVAPGESPTKSRGPKDIVRDGAGTLWVLYGNSNKLGKFGADGRMEQMLEVGQPHVAIAVDPNNDLWLVNLDHTVSKVAPDGTVLGTYGVDAGGLAVTDSGDVWVANASDDTLTHLSDEGKVLGTVALPEWPVRLAIAGDGDLWVSTRTDHGDKNIFKVSSDGEILGSFDIPGSIYGITGAPDGGAWLSDSQGVVRRLSPAGDVMATAAIGGVIYGLASTPKGDLWLTRAGSDDSAVIRLSAKAAKKAEYAVMGNPTSPTLDTQGRVWYLDTLKGAVGRITPAGAAPPASSDASSQLVFEVEAPTGDGAPFSTRLGAALPLAVHFDYRSAPVSWTIRQEDQARASIDAAGKLAPTAPGPIHVVATVEGHEVESLIAVTTAPPPETRPIRLPDGVGLTQASRGATIVTSQDTWDELVKQLFLPNPPPSPAPTIPIDFGRHSVLVLAYPLGANAGGPVVTEVSAEEKRLAVVYPHGGAYMPLSAEDYTTGNQLYAFEIPAVPAETAVHVATRFRTEVAFPLTFQ